MGKKKATEKIKISMYNHVCIVDKASPTALEAIRKHCTIVNGYWSQGKFQKTDSVFLFDEYDNSFPTGYLFILVKKLEENKGLRIDVEGTDCRDNSSANVSLNAKKIHHEDRFNQVAIKEGIRKHNCGFVSSPTATGKTSSMIDTINEHKVKTLVIVPTTGDRDQLAKDFSKAFGKKNVSVSLKSSATLGEYLKTKKYRKRSYDINEDLKGEQISPAMEYLRDKGYEVIETASGMKKAFKVHSAIEGSTKIRRKDRKKDKENQKDNTLVVPNILVICFAAINNLPPEALEQYGMLIVNESQFAKCLTIRTLARNMPNAYYKYAFSATNGREIENHMILLCSVFGSEIIYDVSVKECVEKGIIKRTKMIQVETACDIWLKDSRDKEVKGDDITKLGVVGNEQRTRQICTMHDYGLYDLYHLHKRRVLVEVRESRYAKILQEELDKYDIKSHLFYSDMPSYEKAEVLKILKESTEPFIVFATTAAREGAEYSYG